MCLWGSSRLRRYSRLNRATLVSYIRENLMVGEALCASGNSGGSMELSAALAFRGAAASLDFAMPTSGPAGRLDFACGAAGTFPEWTAQCHEVRDRYGASDRVSCVFDGESAGAWLHGTAGDLARERFGEESLVAGDLVDLLAEAFGRLRRPTFR